MKKLVIFDIDGTLADLEHRRKYLPDWGKFFQDMDKDEPILPIVHLAREMHGLGHVIVLCSGRPSEHKHTTIEWLADAFVPWHFLFMRKEGDYRSDVIVKREILNEQIRSVWSDSDIKFVVDDRQGVVDMWREEGLTCLQCAPGDFDKHLGDKYPSGGLTLLIGPSGGGKTNLCMYNFGSLNESQILSSDRLRHLLCGDFKDQSKNSQVFSAMHVLAKARLQHGLDVVIDATNIRDKDRKQFLDLAPPDCIIDYIVVNRPMEDKIRDGGWRNEIEVKGLPLMEYHERTFRSNLKAILNGDGDSRVTVENNIVS